MTLVQFYRKDEATDNTPDVLSSCHREAEEAVLGSHLILGQLAAGRGQGGMARRTRSGLPRGATPCLPGDTAAVAAPELARESGPVDQWPGRRESYSARAACCGKARTCLRWRPSRWRSPYGPGRSCTCPRAEGRRQAHEAGPSPRPVAEVSEVRTRSQRASLGLDDICPSGARDIFPWASDKTARRIIDRGRKFGLVVTHHDDYQKPLLFRIDYTALQSLATAAGAAPPGWADQPAEAKVAPIFCRVAFCVTRSWTRNAADQFPQVGRVLKSGSDRPHDSR